MGKIINGILGPVSGKIAGVVGGGWKGINYLRAFVIPANPNTAAQQVQRGKFSRCVDWCKILVGPIFNVYTDKFQKKQSGFNFFIKRNIAEFLDPPAFENLKITEGKLYFGNVVNQTATFATDVVHVEWDVDKGSNGLDSDKIFGLAYNETQNLYAFFPAEEVRSDGGVGLDLTLQMDESDEIQIYVFAAKYLDTVLTLISNSDFATAVAA